MAVSFSNIKVYSYTTNFPKRATQQGSIFVNTSSVNNGVTKVVSLGSFRVNNSEVDLYDIFTFEGKFVTTDSEGACLLSSYGLPFCAIPA